MKIEFGDVKYFYEDDLPLPGHYSLVNPFKWWKCREQFAPIFDSKDEFGLFFSHPAGMAEHVAGFISRTEEIISASLNTYQTIKSSFSLTGRLYALWVEPDMFWKSCFWRSSLFTILLRSGMKYNVDVDNYEEALYSDTYAQETKLAIQRFLFGNVHVKKTRGFITPAFGSGVHTLDSKTGWRDIFYKESLDSVRKMLPSTSDSIVGIGSVWN